MNTFYTYFHTRNDIGAVFYVGKGRGKRANSKSRCNRYWHNIVDRCGHTVHKAMTHLTEVEAFEHEKFLILCFKDMGVSLVNCTDGGEGSSGYVATPETRAKNRAANANPSPETRAKLRAAALNSSPETRAKLSAAGMGRVVSPETRAKLSAAGAGRTQSAAARAKISAVNRGKVASAEVRARLVEANRRRVWSVESRAKAGAAQKGNTHTLGYKPSAETLAKLSAAGMGNTHALGHITGPETRAKLSAAGRATWARRRGLERASERLPV